MSLKDELNLERLPRHVAIIMDGNGRWAKKKGLLRAIGHENGVGSLRACATASAELGIENLTVYAFSSENWSRPRKEVNALMSLLVSSLKKELKTLTDNNIRLNAIGRLETLPLQCQSELAEVIEKTKHLDRMTLTLALSYGSKEELVEATKRTVRAVLQNEIAEDEINADFFGNQLFTAGLPDPDLLIRTGGEKRVSNFMLWQIAYAELYFSHRLWPDFDKEAFYEALVDYQRRERRFGKISEQIKS